MKLATNKAGVPAQSRASRDEGALSDGSKVPPYMGLMAQDSSGARVNHSGKLRLLDLVR
jgi:hypothetical protein